MKTYHVYILTNASRSTLYTGVTSKLIKRDFQHETKFFNGFTAKYNVNRLVYTRLSSELKMPSRARSRSRDGAEPRRSR